MKKLLGIDYGTVKIGLAIADDQMKMAVPYKIIKEADLQQQLILIKEIIDLENIDEIVVGLPKKLNNDATEQTAITERFIETLKSFDLSVYDTDERLTSQAAQQQGIVEDDAVAAMYILQSYLDRHYV
ncbi:MAG: Holliday junction resolvase RuvX [Candidatus Komeilibacteria bacterium]